MFRSILDEKIAPERRYLQISELLTIVKMELGILFGISSISGHLYDWTEMFTLSVVYMGVTTNSFFYLFLYLGCNFLRRKKTP